MRIKQMTAALCAYTILGSSLAFAAPSANDRAAAVLSKTRISKNHLVYTQLEEIGRVRESIKLLTGTIEEHINGDFSMHSLSQNAALIALVAAVMIPIGTKLSLKDVAIFTAGSAVVYGGQAFISNYGKKLEQTEIEALEKTINELTKVVEQLEGEELDTQELNKLRANLENLNLEHKKIQETGIQDGVVLTAGYLLTAVHVFAGLFALYGVSASARYGVSKQTIAPLLGSLAILVGSGTGILENTSALPTRIGNEDYEDITRDLDTINTRLDNMVLRLESLL